ncbi:MAG: mechanosensitive ion channel family protein [Desulfobulbaceae bacterium]|jgi:miniconductance mechanosensitive channel|nr:mechanosensitive ion channel family protein [Desulfobulbaceae bacterium]MDH3782179.1 mechanosensitive ion channel family protein [Desulfobulbaceae bacterium]PLX47576.1 MAG: mechanosensitive ion channel protein MscS [Desulfobulbaceae bacterium]
MNDRFITDFLIANGMTEPTANFIGITATIILILLLAYASYWITKRYMVHAIEIIFQRSKNTWDDALVQHGFVRRLSLLMPIIVVYMSADLMLPGQAMTSELFKRLAMVFFVFAGVWMLDAILLAIREIYNKSDVSIRRPIRGYLDGIKIIAYAMAGIFIVSILTGKSPWGVLSILGGFTVVLMLVFKDTILGFVASIQLSGHDMVRVGDWIEMPKYGADGDVINVTIHTIKVRNWDKTITTIPTYSLVSDAFKNWRGMSESGGRRIKRALHIDMSSIKFCTDEMLERFRKFDLIKHYITEKQKEIAIYNKEHTSNPEQLINGRRQTNIGVFRAYIIAYLKNHPKIHQSMTFLVRHLEPTQYGLPVQIYVFSNDQVWANYEAIQADVFDHLLAAVPEFDLRLFQNPSGYDFSRLGEM